MHKLLRYAAVLSLALPSAAAAQAPQLIDGGRLAYFSPQRAFAASSDGQLAQAKLSSLRAERMKEIDARTKALQTQRAWLQQSMTVLGDAARRVREQDIEKFQVDLERFIQDAQAEFAGVQRELENAFLPKVQSALDRVAKDKALLVVFNEDAGLIAWADPSLDITPEVVKQLAP